MTQIRYGFWTKWENVAAEITPHIKNGKFPNLEMLKQEIGSIMPLVVARFGGINEVAKRMGCDPPSFFVTSDGHYVNSALEYIVDEFLWSRGIPHEVNGFVQRPERYRYDFKIGEIFIEVWGYEENRLHNKVCKRYSEKRAKKEAFYKEKGLRCVGIECGVFKQKLSDIDLHLTDLFQSLGFDTSLKKAEYRIENSAKHCRFWSEEKIIAELQPWVDKDGTLPSSVDIKKIRPDLGDAISRHGGFNYFREKLGIPLLQHPNGYWTEQQICDELKVVIAETGDFPLYQDLISRDQFDLIRAINRNGGFTHYRNLLGFEIKRRAHDFWTDEEIVRQLAVIQKDLGRAPRYVEVRRIDKTLISAMDRTKKGFDYFTSKLSDVSP